MDLETVFSITGLIVSLVVTVIAVLRYRTAKREDVVAHRDLREASRNRDRGFEEFGDRQAQITPGPLGTIMREVWLLRKDMTRLEEEVKKSNEARMWSVALILTLAIGLLAIALAVYLG